jgi:hypothetical protein
LVFSAGWFFKVAERPWRVAAVGFNPRFQG